MTLSRTYATIPYDGFAEENPFNESKALEVVAPSNSIKPYRGIALAFIVGSIIVMCLSISGSSMLNFQVKIYGNKIHDNLSLVAFSGEGGLNLDTTGEASLPLPLGKFQIKSGNNCLTYFVSESKSGPGVFTFTSCSRNKMQLFSSPKGGQIVSEGVPDKFVFLAIIGTDFINSNIPNSGWSLEGQSLSRVQLKYNFPAFTEPISIVSAESLTTGVAGLLFPQGKFQIKTGNKCLTYFAPIESLSALFTLATCDDDEASQLFFSPETGQIVSVGAPANFAYLSVVDTNFININIPNSDWSLEGASVSDAQLKFQGKITGESVSIIAVEAEGHSSTYEDAPRKSLTAGKAILQFPTGKFKIQIGFICVTYFAVSKSKQGFFSPTICKNSDTQLFTSPQPGQIVSVAASPEFPFMNSDRGLLTNDNRATGSWSLEGASLSRVELKFINPISVGPPKSIVVVVSGSVTTVANQVSNQGLSNFHIALPQVARNGQFAAGTCCLQSAGVAKPIVLRTCNATVSAQTFTVDATGRLLVTFQASTNVLDATFIDVMVQKTARNPSQIFNYDPILQNLLLQSNDILCLKVVNNRISFRLTDEGECAQVSFLKRTTAKAVHDAPVALTDADGEPEEQSASSTSLTAGTAALQLPSKNFQIKSGNTCLTFFAPAPKSGPGTYSFSACTNLNSAQIFVSHEPRQIECLGAPPKFPYLDFVGNKLVNDNIHSLPRFGWSLEGNSYSKVQFKYDGKINRLIGTVSLAFIDSSTIPVSGH